MAEAAATCSSSPASWYDSTATSSSPERMKSQSMPSSVTVRSIASRFSRPRRSSVGMSSGQRSAPLAKPWVSELDTKPPLRPVAPSAARPPSTRTTSRSGSCCLASSAVHRPVKPAPTTSRSQETGAESRGAGSGRSGLSSQKTDCRVPDSDASASGPGVERNCTGGLLNDDGSDSGAFSLRRPTSPFECAHPGRTRPGIRSCYPVTESHNLARSATSARTPAASGSPVPCGDGS